MNTGHLLDTRPVTHRIPSHRIPSVLPVLWLGLGLTVWGIGLFEPGNLPVEATIVAVLAGVLLLALTAPWLAEIVLVALALVTPTITMIVAALADRFRDVPVSPSPIVRVATVVALVSLPSLVAALLLAHTRHDP